MKLLVVLLVLALRRLEITWPEGWSGEGRVGRWWLPYWQRLGAGHTAWHWLLAVVLPASILALIFHGLSQVLWGFPVWVAGALLLLWLWGGESEFRGMESLLALGRMGDHERLFQAANERFQVPAGENFFARLQQRFLMRDARVVFASIFWLMLLGYGAVVLYLVNRLYLRHYQPGDTSLAAGLDTLLFYPVACLMVLCLALASDFQRVMASVKEHWRGLDGEMLLQQAVIGALSHCLVVGENEFQQHLDRLEVLHATLLRTLALWLVIASVWTMLIY